MLSSWLQAGGLPCPLANAAALAPRALQATALTLHLPPWVLWLPVRRLWVANNQLTSELFPPANQVCSFAPALQISAPDYASLQETWFSRLTHVCLSNNALTELPAALLEHGRQLVRRGRASVRVQSVGQRVPPALLSVTSHQCSSVCLR